MMARHGVIKHKPYVIKYKLNGNPLETIALFK